MRDCLRDDSLDDSLRAAWLNQLYAEFEDICFQFRVNLQPPVFELTDSRTRFGSWDNQYRIIAISVHLIQGFPWKTALQVLKHEMAHQICTDIFAAPDEGHGPLFQKACACLGLSGSFCRAKADCAEILEAVESSTTPRTEKGRRILSRVEKLLALAGSDNEYEAALAMQRAGELLRRHNLDMSIMDDVAFLHLTLNTGRQRMPGYLRGVCSLLQDFFFVQVVCASIYDAKKNVRLRTVELFGRQENVVVAEHCYHFLTGNLVSLWRENRYRFPKGGQRSRNSYFHGVVAGFREKLSLGRQQGCSSLRSEQKTARELMVVEDLGLQKFIAGHFPQLRKGSRRRIRLHTDAYQEAVATGKKLILHRAMKESSANGGLLE